MKFPRQYIIVYPNQPRGLINISIIDEIQTSKKYSGLYEPLLRRICEEEYLKYNKHKEAVKAIKDTLHGMFGAYISADIFKKANKLLDARETEKILQLHASTKERYKYLADFYKFIFGITGQAESILDIGCGFNPFTLGYFPKPPARYYALDIDHRIADINNRYFSQLGLPSLASCLDATTETSKECADVAFLFKLLPLIERQSKGRAITLLKSIKAKHIVVTYPTKSLTGKKKGMTTFYAAAFEEIINNSFKILAKEIIGDELIYIIALPHKL